MTEEIALFTWIGAVLLAFCGVPQAIKAYRNAESTRGISWLFLGAWGVGELAMLIGTLGFVSTHMSMNYAGNVILVAYLCGVKYALPDGMKH